MERTKRSNSLEFEWLILSTFCVRLSYLLCELFSIGVKCGRTAVDLFSLSLCSEDHFQTRSINLFILNWFVFLSTVLEVHTSLKQNKFCFVGIWTNVVRSEKRERSNTIQNTKMKEMRKCQVCWNRVDTSHFSLQINSTSHKFIHRFITYSLIIYIIYPHNSHIPNTNNKCWTIWLKPHTNTT
jgi:hypothetical protein